MNIMRVDNSVR